MTVEISRETAHTALDTLKDQQKRYQNVLQSFRSNELTDCGGHYDRLKEDKEALDEQIADIENQLYSDDKNETVEQADNDEGRGSDSQNHCNDGCEAADEEGLGNLFG